MEIVKLQDAQKGKESRSMNESSSASSRRRSSSPERKGLQDSLKNLTMEGSLGIGDADEKKEIESLKSRLKAVSRYFKMHRQGWIYESAGLPLLTLEKGKGGSTSNFLI